ncbi:MAG: DNA polymerase I [Actinomycetales bacterium]
MLLIDGHSMAYRAYHALPVENFSTTTGQHTNGVYGFTSMLINLLRDESPTHAAVAFDVSRQTFRSEQYTEYKANRSSTPDEFKGQVGLVQEVLGALNIPYLQSDGFEADDIIATLSTQAGAEGFEVVLCSGDRDCLQLVTPHCTMLYPVRGVSELARMTPESVQAKYGVPPQQYPELAALVGETSDNLPGVPGVGAGTAAQWLQKFGDLDQIVARVTEIGGKRGQALRDHLDDVMRNRRLNGLVHDVPLPLTPADLELQGWDREKVHQVFDGLEFRILRDRLFEYLAPPEPEVDTGFDLSLVHLDGALVGEWLTEHAIGGVGVSVDGDLRVGGEATGVALAARDGATAYVDLGTVDPDGESALGEWLADPATELYFHDAKPSLHALRGRGLPVARVAGDTQLAAYLSRPDQRSYDLADLSVRHLHRELRVEAPTAAGEGEEALFDLGESADDSVAESAAVRASAVLELTDVLRAELAERGGDALLGDLELPLVEVLRQMEETGIAADTQLLIDLEKSFDAGVAQAQADAYAALGEHALDEQGRQINLGSPKQLQVVLFDKLGMPKTKRTKTGYTTDADALADLFAKTENEFLRHLLAHRDIIRLRQTVDGLIKSVADDGRIHTTYQQTIAATGRLSSTDPNLQNIPVRTEAGRQIRSVFVVGEGYETLLAADYSQIEMRIMAHLSGDEGLIQAFHSGEDLHRFVGSRVFSVEPQDVTAAMRSKIKAMSYGLAYGLSAFGLSRQLRITTDEANELMTEYFERFGGVRDFLSGVVAQARKDGYTETILGRRRYLPDLTSDNRNRRQMAERMALNAPIQGSAADIIKVAMLNVDRSLRDEGLASRMLLQVHDELVLEVAPGEREVVEQLVRREMAGAADLKVPLDVSVGVGRSWHDAAH